MHCRKQVGLRVSSRSPSLVSPPVSSLSPARPQSSRRARRYTAEWRVNVGDGEAHEVKKHTVAQHRRQLAESLALLGPYRFALYQIHSATVESGVLEAEDVLDELAKLRDEGVAVGASVSHPQAAPPLMSSPPAVRAGLHLTVPSPEIRAVVPSP